VDPGHDAAEIQPEMSRGLVPPHHPPAGEPNNSKAWEKLLGAWLQRQVLPLCISWDWDLLIPEVLEQLEIPGHVGVYCPS